MKHTQHRDTQTRNYIAFLVFVILIFMGFFLHARSKSSSAERVIAEIQASMLNEQPSAELTAERQRLGLPNTWTAGDAVLSEMRIRHAEDDRDRWSRQASLFDGLARTFLSLNVLFVILQALYGKSSLRRTRTK